MIADNNNNDDGSTINMTEATPDLEQSLQQEDTGIQTHQPLFSESFTIDGILSSYIGPRLVLAAVACIYGTNFPLGSLMEESLPASAATCARMVLAALVLSPQLVKLDPTIRQKAVLCGCFTSLGYISQSLALLDTSPATVSFLGTATVLWCPFLEWLVDGKPLGWKEAPQTWLAAVLCLSGVGILELAGGDGTTTTTTSSIGPTISMGTGDVLALVQAIGFGTAVFLSEKMMHSQPNQALPITATLIATTSFFSMLWCFADGWMQQPGYEVMTLPNLFFEPSLSQVAAAVVWTGIVSTSINYFIEITALGKVPSSEASVILSTEPLWAALFASILLHESFGMNDYVGGTLIVMACLANALKPSDFWKKESS